VLLDIHSGTLCCNHSSDLWHSNCQLQTVVTSCALESRDVRERHQVARNVSVEVMCTGFDPRP